MGWGGRQQKALENGQSPWIPSPPPDLCGDREKEVRRERENGTGREGNLLAKYKDFGHNQPQV